MDVLDQKPSLTGGAARTGGALYHLSFRSGSRAGGASARSAYEYVTRQDEYGDRDMDPAIYTESDHMPTWAEHDPVEYWEAADLYERTNGRLYVSADFALPRGLSADEQVALAREFAHELTNDEHLPYTLAIHAGRDGNGDEHNPHAHLMFSERRNDGIERSRNEWFKRANSKHPERGGAPKSRTFHGREWVERSRERWEKLINERLSKAGRSERVDHRSYERQGIDREPGEHYGPAAASILERSGIHDRFDVAIAEGDATHQVAVLDAEIGALESMRADLLREDSADDRSQESCGKTPDRDDDLSWGR